MAATPTTSKAAEPVKVVVPTKRDITNAATTLMNAEEDALAATQPIPAYVGGAPNTDHPTFKAMAINNKQVLAGVKQGPIAIY